MNQTKMEGVRRRPSPSPVALTTRVNSRHEYDQGNVTAPVPHFCRICHCYPAAEKGLLTRPTTYLLNLEASPRAMNAELNFISTS